MSPGTSVTNLGRGTEATGAVSCGPLLPLVPPAPPLRAYRETQVMSLGRRKISWLVLLSCISCPLTLQRILRLWTSVGTEGTHHTEVEGRGTVLWDPRHCGHPLLGKTWMLWGKLGTCCLLC